MKSSVILAVSIFILFPAVAYSATYYVPKDYGTIQEAIDACIVGDFVIVSPGTYVENIDFVGKAITLTSEQGADVTVIDGNQNGSVVLFNSGEGSDSVLDGFTITNGSGTWTVLPYYSGYAGGGIYCRNNASPSIMGNIISKNGVIGGGGGIYSLDSSPTISNNLISQNTALFCGGVYCGQQTPTVTNNIITKNTATSYGGGMYCDGSTAVVVGNDISDNAAYYGGGGVWITAGDASTFTNNMISDNSVSESGALGGGGMGIAYQSIPIIKNSILSGNSSAGAGGAITLFEGSNSTITNNSIYGNIAVYGGGVHVLQNSTPTFINNTICANTAKNNGGGMRIDTDCKVVVTNSIFWGNQLSTGTLGPEIIIASASELTIDYSDADGGQASVHVYPGSTLNWGSGMIDSDPLFVDESNGDFHLTFNSPCRGSGTNTAPSLPLYDFEGDPRIAYGTVDMGADEFYTHLYWTGDATPGGNVEIKFVGLPGTSPVGLCIGTGVLDPPIPSMWGDWYLAFPIIGPVDLGSITSPDGVLVFPGTIPASPPVPYSIPMQALIGAELSNLSILEVK